MLLQPTSNHQTQKIQPHFAIPHIPTCRTGHHDVLKPGTTRHYLMRGASVTPSSGSFEHPCFLGQPLGVMTAKLRQPELHSVSLLSQSHIRPISSDSLPQHPSWTVNSKEITRNHLDSSSPPDSLSMCGRKLFPLFGFRRAPRLK